jgi:hypothetical protein
MDHITTIQYFSQWQDEVAAAKLAGVPFHMGETGDCETFNMFYFQEQH